MGDLVGQLEDELRRRQEIERIATDRQNEANVAANREGQAMLREFLTYARRNMEPVPVVKQTGERREEPPRWFRPGRNGASFYVDTGQRVFILQHEITLAVDGTFLPSPTEVFVSDSSVDEFFKEYPRPRHRKIVSGVQDGTLVARVDNTSLRLPLFVASTDWQTGRRATVLEVESSMGNEGNHTKQYAALELFATTIELHKLRR